MFWNLLIFILPLKHVSTLSQARILVMIPLSYIIIAAKSSWVRIYSWIWVTWKVYFRTTPLWKPSDAETEINKVNFCTSNFCCWDQMKSNYCSVYCYAKRVWENNEDNSCVQVLCFALPWNKRLKKNIKVIYRLIVNESKDNFGND